MVSKWIKKAKENSYRHNTIRMDVEDDDIEDWNEAFFGHIEKEGESNG